MKNVFAALQPWHVIAILLVAFMLFGAKQMPDMARSIGQSLRIFKSEMRQDPEQIETARPALKLAHDVLDTAPPVPQSAVPAPAADSAQERSHPSSVGTGR